jgi:hypothetical protein
MLFSPLVILMVIGIAGWDFIQTLRKVFEIETNVCIQVWKKKKKSPFWF